MRVAGLLAGLVAAPAAAQTVHYEGSAGLATGTYIFTERTSSWSVSTGLALGAGPVSLRIALPVFYQSTTLVASTGSGDIPTGGSSSGNVADSSAARSGSGGTRRTSVVSPSLTALDRSAADPVDVSPTASGFRWATGDPMVSASVGGMRAGRLGVILGLAAKIPLVDTASFGTGAWDVGGSLSASVILGGRAFVALDVGYWHLGDPPELELTDPVVVGGTASLLTATGWGLSAGVTGSTPTIAGFAPAVSATASALKPGTRGSIGLLATVGLTETAPDLTVALTWRLGLRW
jgi:hypothetical protein